MTKLTTAFAITFACLFATSMFLEVAEAGKQKALLKLLLLGKLLKESHKVRGWYNGCVHASNA